MDERIDEWVEKFGFESGYIAGYRGGYPIIMFKISENTKLPKISKRELDRYVRRAEMSAGMELGVGMNFRRSFYADIDEKQLVICAYETAVEKILDSIFNK